MKTCRTCVSWKRRTACSGTCWHETRSGERVLEDFGCGFHQLRVIRTDRSPSTPSESKAGARERGDS